MARNRQKWLRFPLLCLLPACLMILNCSACAGPEAPTVIPLPVNPNVPYSITLGASVGTGTTADHANVTAKVQGPTGVPLAGVLVKFTTTAGTLDPTQAETGVDGVSRTTLIASSAATITASAGNVTARAGVPTQAASPSPRP